MSRPRGGIIGVNATPAATALNSAASGVWTLREAEALKRAGTWPRSLGVPEQISGLQLWLDASDANTLYDATSGGSLVAANGGVARWEDKSGNGRHATQGTSANRPLRKVNQQNGLDAIVFDGTNDCFALSSYTIPSSHSVFQVFRRATSGIQSFGLASTAAVAIPPFPIVWSTDNIRYQISNANFTTHGTANTSTGYFVSTTIRSGTTSIAMRINGVSVATVTTGLGVTNATSGLWNAIGARDAGFQNLHTGNLCEVIAYDSALSDQDRDSVEAYLISKWGL